MKNKILKVGKRFFKNELVSGSLYLFIGSLFSNLIAFLTNLFFARNLSAVDYGVYASLLSLLALTTIPSQSLMSVITRFAADFIANNEENKMRYFYKQSFKFMFLISIILLLVFVFFQGFIKSFLHIENGHFILIIGLTVFFQYLYIVNNAYLQSFLKFIFMSVNTVATAVSKLIFGVILIFLGYKVFGALIAILISFIIPILISFIPLRGLLKRVKDVSVKINYKEVVKYALPTALAILSLTSFISTDVILVKHFFSPKQAGLYGGLSLVGKAIFYLTGMIPSVMFPLLIKRHAQKQNVNNLFYMALLLVAIPSALITGIYFFIPEFVIKLFLGSNYLLAIPYLGIFGIFIAVYSVLNVCVNFFLSLKKTMVFLPVLFFTIFQIFLINVFHQSFFQVIWVSIVCELLLLLALIIYFFREFKKFDAVEINA
jgi:O-antigen/teichoic acid export membrane protein